VDAGVVRTPLRRIETQAGGRATSPSLDLPLVGFVASQSLVCAGPVELSDSPLPPRPRHFWRSLRFFLPTPSPGLLRNRVHPLYASRPFRVLLPWSAPHLPVWSAFLGVACPSSRLEPAASSQRDSIPAVPSVLGVSHALDGLIRLWPRGFISPHSHVQGSQKGVAPRTQPNHLVGGSCPLVG
jgi:hypothetical protein